MQETITDAQWQTFQEQGYVRLDRVVTDEELEGLQQRIDEIMLGQAAVPYERMMMQLDTQSGHYKDMDPQTPGHKGATLAGTQHLFPDDDGTVFLDEKQTAEVLAKHTPETLECAAGFARGTRI